MPIIVTHVKPHIDDIAAAWLLKRYLPAWRSADMEFVTPDSLEVPVTDTVDRVYVGVGRSQFDEHKGDMDDCAASLVYAHINQEVVLNANERKALDRLINWIKLEDTGRLMDLDWRAFSIPAILEDQYLAKGKDSDAVFELGSSLLDALLIGMRNQVEQELEWDNRQEFTSRFGKAVALNGTARQMDAFAYNEGFDLMVRQTEDRDYTEIRGNAKSDIDLSTVQERFTTADPDADWFFHHSKKLLINGGEMTSHARKTGLTLKELIEML